MRATRVFPWWSNNPRAAFWSFFNPRTTRGVPFLPNRLRLRSPFFLTDHLQGGLVALPVKGEMRVALGGEPQGNQPMAFIIEIDGRLAVLLHLQPQAQFPFMV